MATTNTTNVNFVKVMNKSQYDDLTKADGTIYFVVSEKKIYLDGVGYGMSDEDAANFLSIDGGTLKGSLTVTDGGDSADSITITEESIAFGNSDYPMHRRIESLHAGSDEVFGIRIYAGDTYYEFTPGGLNLGTGGSDTVKISGVTDPTDNEHAANKKYVDDAIKTITDLKGADGGFAELDAGGKVPESQLPSYVDDVIEEAGEDSFPTTGESGKIYVDALTNKTYRWSGTGYIEISKSLALGETSATAYRGDRGAEAYGHTTRIDNPHRVTKDQVGLGSVGNYAVASQAEAEAGTASGRYMTPQRTKQAIEKLAPKLTWTVVS